MSLRCHLAVPTRYRQTALRRGLGRDGMTASASITSASTIGDRVPGANWMPADRAAVLPGLDDGAQEGH